MPIVKIGAVIIGATEGPLALIAGPCVIESLELCRQVAAETQRIAREIGLGYIFKASFDKANRTSGSAFRGQGLEKGLEVLAAIKQEFGVPVLTDVHETWQCKPAAEVCDVLQIPAFSQPTDRSLAGRGGDGPDCKREEGAVSRALGYEKRRAESRGDGQSQSAADGARRLVRLQYACRGHDGSAADARLRLSRRVRRDT
jgi:2-dehydro-3-deoxyphosphooctonate aldolase (KDO 8-P synthase)